jgi:hypothetical protein
MQSPTETSTDKTQSQPGADAADDQVVIAAEGEGGGEGDGRLPEIDTEGADRRAAITNRFREKRERQEAEARQAIADKEAAEKEAAEAAELVGDETTLAADEAAGEEGEEPAAGGKRKERLYTVYIEGEPVQKTHKEIIALASKAGGEEKRLAETQRMLEEAARIRDTAAPKTEAEPATVDRDATKTEEPAAKPAYKPDPEKARKRAEAVQVGDLEQGAAALAEMETEIYERAVAAVREELGGSKKPTDDADVDTRVERKLKEIKASEDLRLATEQFAAEHPDLVSKPLLATTFKGLLKDQMLDDWKAAGADADTIATWKGRSPEAVALVHHQMVQGGKHKNLRSYSDILTAGVERLNTDLGVNIQRKPTEKSNGQSSSSQSKVASKSEPPSRVVVPPDEAQRRVQAKQDRLPQPKTAGVRNPSQSSMTRPKTRVEIMNDMRRQRGFSVNR